MELETFITTTLISIKNGIIKANKKLNPDQRSFYIDSTKDGAIKFDIAVVISKEANNKGGGKITIPFINLGGEKNNKDNQEHTSRIKFEVCPAITIN